MYDLDINPVTLTLELDPDVVKIYHHTHTHYENITTLAVYLLCTALDVEPFITLQIRIISFGRLKFRLN